MGGGGGAFGFWFLDVLDFVCAPSFSGFEDISVGCGVPWVVLKDGWRFVHLIVVPILMPLLGYNISLFCI